MKGLQLAKPGERLSVLCLGAHSDDIEIGAGGVVLELAEKRSDLEVWWVVFSAPGERAAEAQASGAGLYEEKISSA